jgi:hypothetical protein
MTTGHHTPTTSGAAVVALTGVTVNVAGGNTVLSSASGDYDIDTIHGVIHVNVFPPATPSRDGPDRDHIYVVRGTAGADPVTLVGLTFIGATSAGTYKFSYNMRRREDLSRPGLAVTTPITGLKIARQRPAPGKLVATAATGTYLHAPGFAAQVFADDPVVVANEHLELHRLYTIAAAGMPTTLNLELDHITTVAPAGSIAVFDELRAEQDPASDD